ncbi:MAG: 3-dehydroquinate synthase [Kiritimatiellaeota bacterium]|nr:3-dehydroquinate synthase [Kiritimatiellota bacterium]
MKILIHDHALDQLGAATANILAGRRAFIVTDENVAPLYLERAARSLADAGFAVAEKIFPAGEAAKSSQNLFALWEAFHAHGITRADAVVALGGGVIGDLAGFAAATWLRGCPVVQVPTTLLAQVDSSIGGKTGIDLPFGKNLAGAFHQPSLTLMDPALLATLPKKEYANGMAEVVKYGCIADAALFDATENFIPRCVEIKREIVSRDERDTGERMVLNFGHTIGHAIEKLSGYETAHGEAVAVGMAMAARVGERHGVTPSGTADKIAARLKACGLPTEVPYPAGELFNALLSDKKNLAGKIHFILLEKIGKAVVAPFEPEKLHAFMREAL